MSPPNHEPRVSTTLVALAIGGWLAMLLGTGYAIAGLGGAVRMVLLVALFGAWVEFADHSDRVPIPSGWKLKLLMYGIPAGALVIMWATRDLPGK